MSAFSAPGVYSAPVEPGPAPEFAVGVPAFLGFPANSDAAIDRARPVRQWAEYVAAFGAESASSYLATAVRGFFQNGGRFCYVVPLAGPPTDPQQALEAGLSALATLEDVDLVAVPDLPGLSQPATYGAPPLPALDVFARLQMKLVETCQKQGGRFALLDPPPGMDVQGLLSTYRKMVSGDSAALYYPWLAVAVTGGVGLRFVPPCGHVAGAYATTDRVQGVYKAPANIELQGVLDLERPVSVSDSGALNQAGVNAMRVFRGRGVRIWGARTLSADPAWIYVNVRRLVLTAGRWIESHLAPIAFEPHDTRLWSRITRELTYYGEDLFNAGALKGATPAQAFFVKCDAETNPQASRDAGLVVGEIGLAPATPNEFVVIRLSVAAGGLTVAAPE